LANDLSNCNDFDAGWDFRDGQVFATQSYAERGPYFAVEKKKAGPHL